MQKKIYSRDGQVGRQWSEGQWSEGQWSEGLHKSLNVFVALFWLACFQSTAFCQTPEASVPVQSLLDPLSSFEPREFVSEDGEKLKYRLLKPADFQPDKKYPLVVFLHGAGERGDDNAAQLKHCMSEFCKPERREKYPCYVLAPQCPDEQKWADIDWSSDAPEFPQSISRSLGLTMEVVDTMLADAAVDKNRVYIAGLSMGGFGTWDALARRPELFAAAIPICGGGNADSVATFKDVPLWCFHGADDKVVKVDRSRELVAALQAAGGQPRYTEYPGVGHDSWTQTFANDETFQWLFGQKRK